MLRYWQEWETIQDLQISSVQNKINSNRQNWIQLLDGMVLRQFTKTKRRKRDHQIKAKMKLKFLIGCTTWFLDAGGGDEKWKCNLLTVGSDTRFFLLINTSASYFGSPRFYSWSKGQFFCDLLSSAMYININISWSLLQLSPLPFTIILPNRISCFILGASLTSHVLHISVLYVYEWTCITDTVFVNIHQASGNTVICCHCLVSIFL